MLVKLGDSFGLELSSYMLIVTDMYSLLMMSVIMDKDLSLDMTYSVMGMRNYMDTSDLFFP